MSQDPEPSQVRPLRLTPQQVAILQARGTLAWIPDQQIQNAPKNSVSTPAARAKATTPTRVQSRSPQGNGRPQRSNTKGSNLFSNTGLDFNIISTTTAKKKGQSITDLLMDAGDWL